MHLILPLFDPQAPFRRQSAIGHSRYWIAVSAAILYYDYVVTLPDEMRLFWSRKDTSRAAALFYTCRYAPLIGHLPIIYAAFTTLDPETLIAFSEFAPTESTLLVYGNCKVILGQLQ
ncbi:hypothetical protein PHLCEN_2v11096 [Hermanssonia centrifuga]|uniref:DUF6533 domain-containing protein n=1 Tax=Hermanssonia centrifuga TaxID=98765 RepID=A0A2R6NLV1_9APHY|nr:hypothetical protein PHLCEN_2v11096 [Hermanssonia centrifuga]